MMVLPDGVPHDQINYEPTETAYVAVRGFEGILTDRPRAIEIADGRLPRWLDDLIDSHQGAHPLSAACQAALALAVLRALADLERDESPHHPAIAAALACMRQQLDEPTLNLDALADAAGCSASHLSLLFRREVRCSPMRMLERLRMDHARQMLAAPYDPVKAVAQACGYNDASYFCRAFRRHAGLSPGRFRRQGRHE
jgi:transcriptional regulator GlxA family with amidase domain